MNRIRWNMVANLAGGLWTSVLTIVAIPFYLRFLGVEAYGLVGFMATLQAVFGILDFGLALTLTRGLARLSAEGGVRPQRDLLRTLEIIYWCIALGTGVAVVFLAGPIAAKWVTAQHLSRESVSAAVRLMGIICALQLPFGLYKAGMMGLQKQVAPNVVTIAAATLRTAGALALLAWVSATVEAFFVWQAATALAQTAAMFVLIWRALPDGERPHFRGDLLRKEWRYAAGVSANAIVGIFLTQSDKVLLSGILPLREFGYYSLAATMASALWWLIIPVNSALFPRFAQLVETGEQLSLRELYHTACQVIALVLLPIGTTVALFAREVIMVWTGNAEVASGAAAVAGVLMAGTMLNGLSSVPTYLASAAGWPELVMYTNLAGAVVLVPAIVMMASRWGAIGAACMWLILNLSYVLITVPLMHRRLLRGELARWYRDDIVLPAAAVLAVAIPARLAMPAIGSRPLMLAYLAAAFVCIAAAALAGAPRARATVRQTLQSLRARTA